MVSTLQHQHSDLALPRLVLARRFAGEGDCAWHVHDAHELVLLTHGRCDISCGEQLLVGQVGTLFILPQGLPQYQITHGHTRTSYICFTASRSTFSPITGTVSLPVTAPAARWFEDICDLDEGSGLAVDDSAASGLLIALLAWLRQVQREGGSREIIHPGLVVATQLITQRIAKPLHLTHLAEELGLSAMHLSRLFRHQYGCGPLRWQQRLRLRAAERMLMTSAQPVAAIARACGYEDANYFIRLFRQRYRMTPGSWRGRSRVRNG
jgi:AraC-like DNA-binding protein